MSTEEFKAACLEMKNEVQKYNGEFVLLWHPNNLWVHEWQVHGDEYAALIEELSAKA